MFLYQSSHLSGSQHDFYSTTLLDRHLCAKALASPAIVVSEAYRDGMLLFELQNTITDYNIGEFDEAFVLCQHKVNTFVNHLSVNQC